MKKQANPAVIGAFVVGAIVLAVTGVLIFGSGRFFSETVPYVMYFTGDIKGLRVGASVDFQGVQIGSVTQIKAVIDRESQRVRIPVVVEFAPDRVETVGQRDDDPTATIAALVERGMRAQLQLESIVTGQLFVQLGFYPDVPAKPVAVDPLTHLPEIPTVPTTLQQVEQTIRAALEKIGQLPLDQMVADLQKTLQGIERLVNAPEVLEAVRGLTATLAEVRQSVKSFDEQLRPVAKSVAEAMGSMEKLAQRADGHATAVSASLTETLAVAREALTQAQRSLGAVNDLAAANSPVRYELVRTLRELSDAARALRALADYLESHPSAILFGRDGEVTSE